MKVSTTFFRLARADPAQADSPGRMNGTGPGERHPLSAPTPDHVSEDVLEKCQVRAAR